MQKCNTSKNIREIGNSFLIFIAFYVQTLSMFVMKFYFAFFLTKWTQHSYTSWHA